MKILFACIAADGHFHPLSGLAVHLAATGNDVRWYTGQSMAARLRRMGIPHYPFRHAAEITADRLPELFPERATLRGPALIRFDGEKVFIGNTGAYLEDLTEIAADFDFDVLFCDAAFYGARPVAEVLGRRVAVLEPGWESMVDDPLVPPPFLGLGPARGPVRRIGYRTLKLLMERMVGGHLRATYNRQLAAAGVAPVDAPVFDDPVRVADVAFLNGVPGLAYPRTRVDPKQHFLGLSRPFRDPAPPDPRRPEPRLPGPRLPAPGRPAPTRVADAATDARRAGRRTVLVSQGTVDNHDPEKLILPTVRALRGSGLEVLVATGSADLTGRLAALHLGPEVALEDWVDFEAVLPHVELFVCNGGSGSLLAALAAGVPLVVAGTREGKNDNNAHVAVAGVGIDLRTERPSPRALRRAIRRVLTEPGYRRAAERIRDEIATYSARDIVERELGALTRSGDRS